MDLQIIFAWTSVEGDQYSVTVYLYGIQKDAAYDRCPMLVIRYWQANTLQDKHLVLGRKSTADFRFIQSIQKQKLCLLGNQNTISGPTFLACSWHPLSMTAFSWFLETAAFYCSGGWPRYRLVSWLLRPKIRIHLWEKNEDTDSRFKFVRT